MRLEEAGRIQLRRSLSAGALAAVCAAIVLLGFEWDVKDTLLGALVGTPIWGALYSWQERSLVPRKTPLEAPPDARLEPGGGRSWLWDLAALAAAGFAISAVIDIAWPSSAIAIGLPAGAAAAGIITATRVRRWERAHGRRLLVDPDTDSPYAGAAL